MTLSVPTAVHCNVASSPIAYCFEQGATPCIVITGSSVIANNTGHASRVGYLVPAS